jgi:hypothetical protein|tara:strand:- start:626 stop:958 length:333 start_codon:yes stop_codon:yes gene_type:complete
MNRYPNRKYVIIPTSKVEDIDFDQIKEKDAKSLRLSEDGEYTFVKFEGDTTPDFLIGFTQYTHAEILVILNDTAGIWYIDEEEALTLASTLEEAIDNIRWSKYNPFNWFN